MMTIDSDILLKNHVSCKFMLKYYTKVLLRQFTKTLNQFLNLPGANKNLEICVLVLFEQLTESNSFGVLSLNNVLINGNYFKNTK